MSEDTAREIEESYQVSDEARRRHQFIARMEHKLQVKERRFERS